MAHKRMFSKDITGSDAFREMPTSTQNLYFHIGMDADDDGFLDSYRGLMRSIGASEDDLRVLIGKRFVLPRENGIIVIKHWFINNFIRKDRYTPTRHAECKSGLYIKENKAYSDNPESGIPLVNQMAPQKRIEEKRIEENRIEEKSTSQSEIPETINADSWSEWVDYRKEIKKKMTPRTMSLQFKHLQKYSIADQKEIIDQSIRNGWTGLFDKKDQPKQNQQTPIIKNKYSQYD